MTGIGCYGGVADHGSPKVELLGRGPRIARALAGAGFIASAGVLYVWPWALLGDLGVPGLITWPLAGATLWIGVSHLVAAATAYRGCPEVGAIPSLLLRRDVLTTCVPWERADRRIEGAQPSRS